MKIAEYIDKLMQKRRARYKLQKQEQLKNLSPTIIGNNCVCGIIYKDLNLQYTSPTINVLIPPYDFLLFAENLEQYLSCDPEETFLEEASYPVGLLKNGEEQIYLHFVHNDSFQEAKETWLRRRSRMDMDNLFLVFQFIFPRQKLFLRKKNAVYKRFKALPYANKRLMVNACFCFDKEVVALPQLLFTGKSNTLLYFSRFSKKRLMDHLDYVRFLNKE